MYKNPLLHESVKAYVIAAITLINHNPDERCLSDDWSNTSGIMFVLSREKLKKLPDYERCRQILQSDSKIVSQLENLMGVHCFRRLSPDIDLIMVRLPKIGIYKNHLKFNAANFEREYKNFENAFYDEDITYEAIVPVTGNLLNRPVKLSTDLELCLVTRKDFAQALTEDKEHRLSELIWAIRVEYKLPKILGSEERANLVEIKKNDSRRNAANSLIDAAIVCLRLFGISNVSPIANTHRTTSFIFEHSCEFPIKPAPNTEFALVFDRDISSEFLVFWSKFRAAIGKYRFIDLAARRYGFTYERHNQEDQILDLLIAAEALFLSETKQRGSISARLTERASFFPGDDEPFRKQVKEDFRAAYRLRSLIVHGNDKSDEEIRKIEGKEVPLYGEDFKYHQFISRVQNHIQKSIIKMVDLAEAEGKSNRPRKKLIDWDALINSKRLGK